MKKNTSTIKIYGHTGIVGHHNAFMGFAPASILKICSFIDLFDEDTGVGYQRPLNREHSRDFKRYIVQPGASTIPLIFNLRISSEQTWVIHKKQHGLEYLEISALFPCFSVVDGQHRLNELDGVDIQLAFMAYIGLDLRTEMALFNVINKKARGISSSLIDFQQSVLLSNLIEEAPHLYIARRLHEDPDSPWYKQIRYGGESTSGLKRRTSLRMMQHSINGALQNTLVLASTTIEPKYNVIRDYWIAVRNVFPNEWENHRTHLITKGIGLYALMMLFVDIVNRNGIIDVSRFTLILEGLKKSVNWQSNGPFSSISGRKGANTVYSTLKKALKL